MRMRARLTVLASRPRPVSAWVRGLRLPPWAAALIGALAGLLVGLAMTMTMIGHQVFTQPHQDMTAGAALLAIWTCIGIVAALTVLAPDELLEHADTKIE